MFDKTGTLTTGRMEVLRWDWLEPEGPRRAAIAAGIVAAELRAGHPAARALVERLGITPSSITDWREQPGGGVVCRLAIAGESAELRVGSPAFAGDVSSAADTDESIAAISLDGSLVARATLGDGPRADAAEMVATARAAGWTPWLLSGDRAAPVAEVAGRVGIAREHAIAGLAPEGKAAQVAALGRCVVIGDGANDAAAMRAATVAIGVRGGLAAVLDCCDAVLVGTAERRRADALAALIAAARSLRATRRLLAGFALAYNLAGIGLVAAGAIGPWICAVAMPASSLAVIAIAASCRMFRTDPSPSAADGSRRRGQTTAPRARAHRGSVGSRR